MHDTNRTQSYSFAELLDNELDVVAGPIVENEHAQSKCEHDEGKLDRVLRRAEQANLVGLSFSGGGIRSATFNLGVLQGLANLDLLKKFHYLSTVSGGGYIGSWFKAWVHRRYEERNAYDLVFRNDANKDSIPSKGERQIFLSELGKAGDRCLHFRIFDDKGVMVADTNETGIKGRKKELERLKHQIDQLLDRDYMSSDEKHRIHHSVAAIIPAVDEIEQELRPDWIKGHTRAQGVDKRKEEESGEIRFLRKYSNYLTPKVGWFGADMWTAIAIYLRNLILNLTLVVAAFGSILFLAHLTGLVAVALDGTRTPIKIWAGIIAPCALLLCISILTAMNVRYRGSTTGKESDAKWFARQNGIQKGIVFPLFLAALLGANEFQRLAAFSSGYDPLQTGFFWALATAILVAIVFGGVGALIIPVMRSWGWCDEDVDTKRKLQTFRAAIVSALFLGYVLWGIAFLTISWSFGKLVTWFPPLIACAFVLCSFLFVGLSGPAMPDGRREWWARVNAFTLTYALGWMALFGVTFYGPTVVYELTQWWAAIPALSISWVLATVGGLLAGRSAASSSGDGIRAKIIGQFAGVSPYIFIAGLALLLSCGVAAPIVGLPENDGFFEKFGTRYWLELQNNVEDGGWITLIVWAVALFVVSIALSVRLDINQFSMHMMYRNRLVRCYLGASRRDRRPHPFTGFDPNDDIDLADLRGPREGCGPYPIINTTLNLIGGKELAWQKRKAGSFVFTPGFCGYDLAGYADDNREGFWPTKNYAGDRYPLTLGTTLAISGAAASPNMGYHTSTATALLMTLFNVRLGWWIGNPANRKTRQFSSPRSTLTHLFKEMFGATHAGGEYVYLSDGGHFENLGIYELVRRRCRFILACDAEQDAEFTFGGLGNAIEKCRSDLGVEITLSAEQVRRRDKNGCSLWSFAVGTIDYGEPESNGILVYIKSSLNGDVPEDVLRYAAKNELFPHESTGDQWFDESQFESYRRLGQTITTTLFEGIAGDFDCDDQCSAEAIFSQLKRCWNPHSESTKVAFSRHATTVTRLYEKLRSDANLEFLNEQIHPQWNQFLSGSLQSQLQPDKPTGLPTDPAQLRHGFYFCNSVALLMEQVYHDLDLEKEHSHPDNRGWMNFFKHWSWASMFRVTWTISASTYGARFQNFCERRLGLDLGELSVEAVSYQKTADSGIGFSDDKGLNWYERNWISEFLKERRLVQPPELYVLKIAATSGSDLLNAPDEPKFPKLNCGFCLIEPSDEQPAQHKHIIAFRIQDHLRNMGLARRAVRELFRSDENGGSILNAESTDFFAHREDGERDGMRGVFERIVESVRLEVIDERQGGNEKDNDASGRAEKKASATDNSPKEAKAIGKKKTPTEKKPPLKKEPSPKSKAATKRKLPAKKRVRAESKAPAKKKNAPTRKSAPKKGAGKRIASKKKKKN